MSPAAHFVLLAAPLISLLNQKWAVVAGCWRVMCIAYALMEPLQVLAVPRDPLQTYRWRSVTHLSAVVGRLLLSLNQQEDDIENMHAV